MKRISSFASRLNESMQYSGMKQYELSQKSGISKSLLNKYIKGVSLAGNDKLYVLSEILCVSPVWLMGYDVPRVEDLSALVYKNVKPLTKVRLPVLGEISCGIPNYASEEIYVQVGTEIKADFCLIARGDSMIGARIHDGDIIFVRKQDVVDNGDIAVVIIDDDATLKRVFYYPEKRKLVLQAENPAYEPFVYVGEELDQIKILGKAVAFQSDVK